jgi:inhibitor of cysteine peptidase
MIKERCLNATIDQNEAGLPVIDEGYLPDDPSGTVVGSGGMHTWVLVPEEAGTYSFSAVYMRPWEIVTGDEERFDLTVVAVEPAG